jgi:hypothetical protein
MVILPPELAEINCPHPHFGWYLRAQGSELRVNDLRIRDSGFRSQGS